MAFVTIRKSAKMLRLLQLTARHNIRCVMFNKRKLYPLSGVNPMKLLGSKAIMSYFLDIGSVELLLHLYTIIQIDFVTAWKKW